MKGDSLGDVIGMNQERKERVVKIFVSASDQHVHTW